MIGLLSSQPFVKNSIGSNKIETMKNKIILIALVFCVSCGNVNNIQTTQKHENFNWLVGEWIRTNEKPDQTTYENWERISEHEYKGNGFTISVEDNDTIWSEVIQLIKEANHWSFNVLMKGEKKATKFALSNKKENQFVCKNQLNDFPKMIVYEKMSNQLIATISGGGNEVVFEFERIER